MDTARESAPRSESAQVSPNTIPLPVPQPNTCKGEWKGGPSAGPELQGSGPCGVVGSKAGWVQVGPGYLVPLLCERACLVITEEEVASGDSGTLGDPGQGGSPAVSFL